MLNSKIKPLNACEEILIYYKKGKKYNPQKIKGKPYSINRKKIKKNYATL